MGGEPAGEGRGCGRGGGARWGGERVGGACEMRKGSSVRGLLKKFRATRGRGLWAVGRACWSGAACWGQDSPVGSLRDLEAAGHQGSVLLAFSRATAQ